MKEEEEEDRIKKMKWINTNIRFKVLWAWLAAIIHLLRNPHLLDLLASLLERLFGGGKPETNIRGMNKGRVNELTPESVMLTSSFFPPGLINLIKAGFIRLSKNIAAWLRTIISSYPLNMYEFIGKLQKVIYFLLFLYLVVKNLTTLLDLFLDKSVLFASFDANSTDDSILNRKIKVENKMIEYQREQLMEIKTQLSTLQDESKLSKEQLEEKEALLQEKGEIERFINKEVKEKINLTKGKSSYNTSNISGSKRLGGDLNSGPSQKK